MGYELVYYGALLAQFHRTAPQHGCLQLLLDCVKLLTKVVGLISAHMCEVISTQRKVRHKLDL
jgi:hypothetical protein